VLAKMRALAAPAYTGAVKAVVVERPHVVAYGEVESPVCGPDDVLVRSHAAGLCRTDVEIITGVFTDPRWVRFPCIPGHEWSGTVAEAGANVDDLRPGERVVCEGMIPCHRCVRCRTGRTHLCEQHEALGFNRPGGYGELVAVPRHVVHRLPEHVSFDAGVLVEPASVVLHGLEKSRPEPGETAGVIGVGTIGSLAVTLLRLASPATIVAYGVREEELELARRLGAHHVVNVAEQDAEAETRRLAGGGLDLVVETAGAVAAVELATRLVRDGGRAVLLGIAGAGKTIELLADLFVVKDLTLIGSIGYTTAVWTRVIELLAARLVDLDPIVTHRFAARDFRDALELMDNREGIVGKIVLEHR
jgi:2-desacetyl-2-hydroxyethyl bacteriochlorophyllide A dehydrogenase